jgi:ADP-heptose:LPS heptosyltransferase
MKTIRLISDELTTYTPNPSDKTFQVSKNYVMAAPHGKCCVVIFVDHALEGPNIHPLVLKAVCNDIGVVYVCTKMPCNPIYDPHVHYIEVPDKWFIHTLFFNPLAFAGVIFTRSARNLAQAFSQFTQYLIPVICNENDIIRLAKKNDSVKDNVLIEIVGGLGDHLITIPSLKSLSAKGKSVYVLCEDHRKCCFQNLPYIKGIYTLRQQVDISMFPKVICLHFGQLLNDYRQDFNKQNRIYAVAELCGLKKSDLVIDRPEIILSKEEFKEAELKWGSYKRKIFIGADSARIDSKLPNTLTQEIINKLKNKGYTVFTSSSKRYEFKNCIDLNKKLTPRQLFALISQMDCVLTVDTSFLHIAGAFNKKTFCVFNYFNPEWRASTYKNCTAYKPDVPCFPCFPANTLVNTENGLKPIQDIGIGEKVLTHTGKLLPVTKTFKRDYSGELVGCKPKGWGDYLYSTPEHPYFNYDKQGWVEAKDLRIKDHLYRPKLNFNKESILYDLSHYTENLNYEFIGKKIKQVSSVKINNTRIQPVNRYIPLDSPLAKLFGYYLAEGSLKDNCVRFTFHQKEKEYINDVFFLMKNIFDISGTATNHVSDKSVQLQFTSTILSNFFKYTCGRNTLTKKVKSIPKDILLGDTNVAHSLLQGFFNGDAQKTNKNIFSIKLTEKQLANDIYCLFNYLGLSSSFSYRLNKPNAFHKNFWWTYNLTVSKRSFYNSNKLFYHRKGEYEIQDLKRKRFSGNVYNLEVLEDNSYCVMGYAVHNCVAKQFVASCDWHCHKKSCYEYQDWNKIYQDISDYFKGIICKDPIQVTDENYMPPEICEDKLPGKILRARPRLELRIAAFWMGGLGDAVMLGYLCRAILRKHPTALIDAYVRDLSQTQLFIFDYPSIRAIYSATDWIRALKTNKDNYDLVYEFRPYPYVWNIKEPEKNTLFDEKLYNSWHQATQKVLAESQKQTFLYYADQLGLEFTNDDFKLPLPNVESRIYQSYLDKYSLPSKYITVHSGCDQGVGVMKLWPSYKWGELIERLKVLGYTVIQLGSKDEEVLPGVKKVTTKNLIDLAYVLQHSLIHVDNEGGLVHLAHSVGTRSVVMFGPTNPTLYGYVDNINLYKDLCPTCWWTVIGWSKKCKEGHSECINIRDISVDEVYDVILAGVKDEN